jgi:hypothetical protein
MQVESIDTLDVFDRRLQDFREATKLDNAMQSLTSVIKEGWPEEKSQVPPEIREYYAVKDMLGYQDGLILKGEQIVVPKSLLPFVKQKLHLAHMGFESMLRRARNTVYWPRMKYEIQQIADQCDTCQSMKPNVVKETLVQHDEPKKPWVKVGLDIFELEGRNYLVTIDYFSNYIEVDYLTTTTAAAVILKLKGHFYRYGAPEIIISDGGPQFTSKEFAAFAKEWGCLHSTSSPNHQQSNGKAEAAVKIMETMMSKTRKDGNDQYEALLELRNTPRRDTLLSPSQMFFGRATRGLVPCVNIETRESPDIRQAVMRRQKHRQSVKIMIKVPGIDLHSSQAKPFSTNGN